MYIHEARAKIAHTDSAKLFYADIVKIWLAIMKE